ncbi:hypothetical protein A0O21_00415 [Streptococcus pantholopis]|uniref:Uncharacterized protein n=1 Tax=Streptococcus pantholopis TaxID=1811193 RepID=A0A172Q556_9STRE|nr:hypothetical protein A0O21_00415 [Streptococcus pantholopis]
MSLFLVLISVKLIVQNGNTLLVVLTEGRRRNQRFLAYRQPLTSGSFVALTVDRTFLVVLAGGRRRNQRFLAYRQPLTSGSFVALTVDRTFLVVLAGGRRRNQRFLAYRLFALLF